MATRTRRLRAKKTSRSTRNRGYTSQKLAGGIILGTLHPSLFVAEKTVELGLKMYRTYGTVAELDLGETI
jgi:hypothetical protein